MKNNYILIITFFTCLQIKAQDVTTINNQYSFLLELVFHNDDLYFSTGSSISKINITETNSSSIEILPSSSTLIGTMIVVDNYLYYGTRENDFGGKISKIDLTAPNSTPITILNTDNQISSIAIKENKLYFIEGFSNTAGCSARLRKIDLNETNSIPEDILFNTCLDPIAIKDNYLYIGGISGISKIDITQENPETIPVHSDSFISVDKLSFNGTDLYYSDQIGSIIKKIDITQDFPTESTTILSSTIILEPTAIAIRNNELFFNSILKSDFSSGIHKIGIPEATLSVNDNQILLDSFSVYPNPFYNNFQVSGLTKKKHYTIYNSVGCKIVDGVISNNEKIETEKLNQGMFFLKLEGFTKSIKLIKK